jgi:hypothetical protein
VVHEYKGAVCDVNIHFNPLSGNAHYFSILLCLMPDDFTHQVENAATQWVNPINNLPLTSKICLVLDRVNITAMLSAFGCIVQHNTRQGQMVWLIHNFLDE